MNYRIALFILVFTFGSSTIALNIQPLVEVLPVGSQGSYMLNETVEYIILITNFTYDLSRNPPRVELECLKNCSLSTPALIVIKQKSNVASMQLPMIVKLSNGSKTLYNSAATTLCPYGLNSNFNCKISSNDTNISFHSAQDSDEWLTISLSTANKVNISVTLYVTQVTDFVLVLNDVSKTINLTPSKPHFYLYEFPRTEENGSVVLTVNSSESTCMLISIQNKSCPLVYSEQISYNGYFQTVTKFGAVTITNKNFPFGFYALFTLYADDSYCSSQIFLEEDNRSKNISISIRNTITAKSYFSAIAKTIAFIVVFYILVLTASYFAFVRSKTLIQDVEIEPSPGPSSSLRKGSSVDDTDIKNPLSQTMEDTMSGRTDSSLDETDVDFLVDIELDKNIFRTKKYLYLSDLAKKNTIVLKKKSELYFWNLIIIAVFYGLPASQLVFSYQYNLIKYGNEDLCYYNFLCSHPLGYISDFNHFFSNIGYVCFGFLFIIITSAKQQVHKTLVSQNVLLDREYGVPPRFGLFYSMGIALVMEGILSACYHLCPNINNFQFDVSFMYVIAMLCMIQIYQSRHPDVNATAYSSFFLMAAVLFLNICGVYLNDYVFWGICAFLHFICCLHVTFHIYYVGRFKYGFKELKEFLKEIRLNPRSIWPTYPTRFILIAIINICNWAIILAVLMIGFNDVSSYLLIIFLLNLMLYTTFYIIMKLISKEKILLQPLVYIILAGLSCMGALFYFFNKMSSWKKTPSESRLLNKPCVLFDFYDNHDIWHYISSMGVFFSFMVLLTLDDDLIFVHRSQIPVF